MSTFSAERPGQWALGAQLAQAPVRVSPEIERTVQAIEGERKSLVRVSVRGRLLMDAAELAQKTVQAPCAAAGRGDSGAASAMTPETQQPGCWLPLLSLRHSWSQPLHLPGLCHRGSCELFQRGATPPPPDVETCQLAAPGSGVRALPSSHAAGRSDSWPQDHSSASKGQINASF